jgi:polyribonucleotide nucleotidyltransferase
MPDALAGLAASAALAVSDIPFHGPISEVRVSRVNGEFIVNPTFDQVEIADLDIIVGATYENIMMVEGEMKEVSEDVMLEALRIAHEAIKPQCVAQKELSEMVGKSVKREYCHEKNDEELRKKIWDETYDKCYRLAASGSDKKTRTDGFEAIKAEFLAQFPEDAPADEMLVNRYFHDVEKEAARRLVLDEHRRLDGRKLDEIRPIWCEIDPLPAAHGSAIFTRGETQSLTTVTLGTKLDEKMIDEVLKQGSEKFTLHYNFPPFATGEAKPLRGTSRREIGHGNLAHRALKNMMPPEETNPYAIRVVSDILESNGSSSMATVCAGTLALMDAGIQIAKPVSGIAMGLITDKDGKKFAVLSDILGDEDHLGDMDFKVAGTRDGITATQMDIKVDGLSFEVLKQALEQARRGRMHILDVMEETIAEPRPDLKPHAPRIEKIFIPKEMIGAVIGPGGKIVQDIQATTGATIVIEETNGQGVVDVFGENYEVIRAALDRINAICAVPEVGKVYTGKVKTITQFGAFVEILPNKDGLLHISEMDWKKVGTVEELFKEGDTVEVQLIEIDQKTGKLRLSRKPLIPKPEGWVEPPRREHTERKERQGSRDGNRGDRGNRDHRPHDRRRDNNRQKSD